MPKNASAAPIPSKNEPVHTGDHADIRRGPCPPYPPGRCQRTRVPRRFPPKTSLCTQAAARTPTAGRARRTRPGDAKERECRADFLQKRACAHRRPRGHPPRAVPAVPAREMSKNASAAPIPSKNEPVHTGDHADIRRGPCPPYPPGRCQRTRVPRRFPPKTSLCTQAITRTSAAGRARHTRCQRRAV